MNGEHSITNAQGLWSYLHANACSRAPGATATKANNKAVAPPVSIAISRQAGIDAGGFARAFAAQLGWLVWDHELLELIAMRLGSNVADLQSLDERHVSWIQESLEAFLSLHAVNQPTFVRYLREAMEELSARGNCIIVGRGAPHILPHNSTLKVRLVAPLEQRIATFKTQMKITDSGHAVRELERIDRERARFVSEHFHKDSQDPAAYDLVLNVSHFTAAECTQLVLDSLHAIERLRTAGHRTVA